MAEYSGDVYGALNLPFAPEAEQSVLGAILLDSSCLDSVAEILEAAKTKRYAHARLRRMVLWAYLGLASAQRPEHVPYLRVLAANEIGRTLLGRMRDTASAPVLTKPGHARRLGPEARALFELETRAADLYTLAYPALTPGGGAWREGPVIR